jgi:hypothetical protein
MAVAMGQLSPDQAEPRINKERFEDTPAVSSYVRPQHRKLHDTSVSFEEYHYYALIARAEEDELSKNDIGDSTWISYILPSKSAKGDVVHHSPADNSVTNGEEKVPGASRDVNDLEAHERAHVTDDEWMNASRALRTASWSAVFYLITTDILGPFNVP